MLLYRPTPVVSAGADGPVSADPREAVRPLDPAKKVAALKISCGGLFTHFDRHNPSPTVRNLQVYTMIACNLIYMN